MTCPAAGGIKMAQRKKVLKKSWLWKEIEKVEQELATWPKTLLKSLGVASDCKKKPLDTESTGKGDR